MEVTTSLPIGGDSSLKATNLYGRILGELDKPRAITIIGAEATINNVGPYR